MARRLLEPDAQVVISDVPQDRPKDSRYPPGAWRRRNWETLAALVRDSSDLARSPGRRTRKVVPRPCEDSTSMLPPSAVTSCLVMYRPRPMPARCALEEPAWRKRSNTYGS